MKPQKCEHCGETCYDTEDAGLVCDKCLRHILELEKENEEYRNGLIRYDLL